MSFAAVAISTAVVNAGVSLYTARKNQKAMEKAAKSELKLKQQHLAKMSEIASRPLQKSTARERLPEKRYATGTGVIPKQQLPQAEGGL
jgi:hypothetical protein